MPSSSDRAALYNSVLVVRCCKRIEEMPCRRPCPDSLTSASITPSCVVTKPCTCHYNAIGNHSAASSATGTVCRSECDVGGDCVACRSLLQTFLRDSRFSMNKGTNVLLMGSRHPPAKCYYMVRQAGNPIARDAAAHRWLCTVKPQSAASLTVKASVNASARLRCCADAGR